MEIIEFDRWKPSADDPRKLEYAGQRIAQEVFEELKHRLEGMGYLPDEYFLLRDEWQNGREIPRDADLFCTVDYHTALRLRSYLLSKGNSPQPFAQAIPATDHIASEVFDDYAAEFRQGGGRVTAVLDIDLDRGEFSTLDAADGWERYTIRDVSTAAWRASRKDGLKWEKRLELFAAHLEPRMIRCGGQGLEAPSGPSM